jgi:CHAT domain-containing protein/tetratricopeptide (TPR) repeat protein
MADTSNEILSELERAAAVGDTAFIGQWIHTSPGRVYLATVRLANRALGAAARHEAGGAEDLHAAGVLGEVFQERTGQTALADLAALYASYDAPRIAQHAQADSLVRAGDRLYAHGEYARARAVYERSLAIQRELGNRIAETVLLSMLAGLESATGELDSARRRAQDAIALGEETGYEAALASGLFALGSSELAAGNLQDAITAFRKTQRIGLELGEDNYVASSLSMLANAYYLAGRYHDSLAMHEDALALFRRKGLLRNVVGELTNIALIKRTDLASYHEAGRALEEAIEISRAEGFASLEGIALSALADVQCAQGRREDALVTVSRAIARLETVEESEQLANAVTERGRILRELGRVAESRRELSRALALARGGVSAFALCETLVQLAGTEAEAGQPRTGLARAREAIEIFEATRSGLGAENLRASSLHLRAHFYEAALRCLYDLSGVEPEAEHAVEGFRLAEQYKSGTLLDFLAARRRSREMENPAHAALAEELSSLQLALLADPGDQDSRNELCRDIRAVRARLDSLETADLEVQRGAYRGEVRDAPSVVQTIGAPGDLLLEFFWGREMVYAWALTPHETRFFAVGVAQDLEGLMLICGHLLRDRTREPLASPALSRLADALLGPVRDLLPAASRLVVVPDGPLLDFPLEVLPWEEESAGAAPPARPEETGAETPAPLIAALEVCYVPSASLWRHLTLRAARRAPPLQELLALGDPASRTESWTERWPRLAYASAELARLEKLLSPRRTRIVRGEAASEDLVKSDDVAGYGVLHFATHARAGTVDPSASGLLLAPGEENDGFVTPEEILGLRLRADLVTLSGCETARGRIVSGEGVLGLSRAFFHAGATSVLASLWEVDDQCTASFMSCFYRHLAAGERKGTALMLAKRELCAARDPDLGHPCSWAPFVLTGDPDGVLRLTRRAWYETHYLWPACGGGLSLVLLVGAVLRRRSRTSVVES